MSSKRETSIARTDGTAISIETPSYRLRLDTADGLRGVDWENRLTGRTVSLGNGLECEAELDAAHGRYWIEGWAIQPSAEQVSDPDEDSGFLSGFYAPEYDDSAWRVNDTFIDEGVSAAGRCVWARTNLFVPNSAAGLPLSLVLGGYGLGDYRYMRVFLNGYVVGTRRTSGRWNTPGVFDIGPESQIGPHVRIGQINVIAVQLRDQFVRPRELDEIDPFHNWHLPAPSILATPFERYVVAGTALTTPRLLVETVDVENGNPGGSVVTVSLRADDQTLSACVRYRANADDPVLRRETSYTNTGPEPVRLMHARLGDYQTQASVSDGERGFPVYIDDDRFVSIACPSGWNVGNNGRVTLTRYPGVALAPGQSWDAGEVVYGVGEDGEAREQFLRHIESRMRRTVRGHDHPYAIFTAFGSWPIDEDPGQWVKNSEEIVLDSLAKVAEAQGDTGCRYDVYNTDFWVDSRGDLTRFAPDRFPDGFDHVRDEIHKLGSAPGLWIDSSMGDWTIGRNPAVATTRTYNESYAPGHYQREKAFLCRATDPTKSLYVNAFRHHIRENGVRLLKFDNNRSYCSNLAHDHLPGIYSTEAIHDAFISFLSEMDTECPDVLLMLYWGCRSPWWLLHADTLFEPGVAVEAASPAAAPTLYVRDGVTLGLDQVQRYCRDVPPLGKDSLGVWLSDWWWNSSIGKERWQAAFVMDICRGSMLAQPWSDHDWLTPPERREIAEFIALLRAHPECFGNSRLVVGDPLDDEPYGYACASCERAFVAVNNPTWEDVSVELSLGSECGLPDGMEWSVYRRYPAPARLVDDGEASFTGAITLALRPFDVVLVEIVQPASSAALGVSLPDEQIARSFAEPSRAIDIADLATTADGPHLRLLAEEAAEGSEAEDPTKTTLRGTLTVPARPTAGILAVAAQVFDGERVVARRNAGRYFAAAFTLDGKDAPFAEAVGLRTYPCGWQVWRLPVGPSEAESVYELTITVAADAAMRVVSTAHLVPEQ